MYWSAANKLLSLLVVVFTFSTFSFGHGLSAFRGYGGGLPHGRLGPLLSLTSATTSGKKENWLQRWRKPKVQLMSHLQQPEEESAVDAAFEKDVFSRDEPTRFASPVTTASDHVDDEEEDARHEIKLEELSQALEKARRYVCDGSVLRPTDDICRSGWSLVHESADFHLFKRRLARDDGSKGPIEYLMTGSLSDISPFSFLAAQIHRSWRSLWDNTMKEMSQGTLYIQRNHGCSPVSTEDTLRTMESSSGDGGIVEGGCHISPVCSSDKLYYRTKWPWPLQDRDYALVRRCRIFPKENAFVLVSRSTQDDAVPPVDGVVRVDKYWCHSVVFSTSRNAPADGGSGGSGSGGGGGGGGDVATDGRSSGGSSDQPPSGSAGERAATTVATTNDNHANDGDSRPPDVGVPGKRPSSFAERQWAAVVARHDHHDHHDHRQRWTLSGIQQRLLSPWTRPPSSRDDGPETAAKAARAGTATPRDPLSASSPAAATATWCNTLHRRGLCFVTMFSDEQQVPLPAGFVDALASVGEKVVPESIRRLCEVARRMDTDEGFAAAMRIPIAEAGGDVVCDNDSTT